jgi:hypothetical protein
VAAQVMRFFASTDLVTPGLVRVEEWRPDPEPAHTRDDKTSSEVEVKSSQSEPDLVPPQQVSRWRSNGPVFQVSRAAILTGRERQAGLAGELGPRATWVTTRLSVVNDESTSWW